MKSEPKESAAPTVFVKGVVYDLDGKTALLSPQVLVSVKNSGNLQVGTAVSSSVNGSYSAPITGTLNADNMIVVNYTRSGLSNSCTIAGGLTGLVTQTINPIVPT